MFIAKGMVQFGEATYRIAEVGRGRYEAIRISDDVRMGTFETVPTLRVKAEGADEKVLLSVARTALMQAKTSWLASGPFFERNVTSSADGKAVTGVEVRASAPARVKVLCRSPEGRLSGQGQAIFARLWRGIFPLDQPRVAAA
jgi:hypothetical protein